jgi:DNA-binding NarL/FixJ family response regulator
MVAATRAPDNRGIEIAPAKPIHVVVSDLTGMLRDIVTETLEAAPDLVVTVVSPPESALAAVAAAEADVAVLAGGVDGLPAAGRELLDHHPRLHVMAVRRDGRDASLYELRPHERRLGGISPAVLLDAVRRVGPVQP